MRDYRRHFLWIIQRLSSNIASAVSIAAILALVVLMLIMAIDAILRNIFNTPLSFALDLSEFSLVIIIFAGIAFTAVKKGHVSVDTLIGKFKPSTRAVIDSIASLIALTILVLIVWQTVLRAGRSWSGDEAMEVLSIPISVGILIVAIGSAVWLLVVLSDFLSHSTGVLGKGSRQERTGLLVSLLIFLGFCVVLAWYQPSLNIDPLIFGIIILVLLIPVLFSGIPVGFVLILLGLFGIGILAGFDVATTILGQIPFVEASSYSMTVIPLFILMGELVLVSGLSQELYGAAYKWVGHLRGGLASATVLACAGFAAVCGSTTATAVTLTTVALPEMRKYNYAPSLATGCIAAGGVIGTMIPPSVTFIVYGLLTEQSIGRLFIAGIVPGVTMAVLFIIVIAFLCRFNPNMGPSGPQFSIREKMISVKNNWLILLLFIVVIGGIYWGIFTPTEAAGIGALGALAIGFVLRRFNRYKLLKSMQMTIVTTCMVFFLFIGGAVFSTFVALSQIATTIATVISQTTLPPLAVIALILTTFIVLGCVMPSLPVTVLMVPVVFPTIIALGYDPIWFGVMVVLMNEMGALTPPVGINVFAVAGVAQDVPMSTIFRGAFPFLLTLIAFAGLLIAFPQIALFLPTMMKGS